MSLHMSLKHSGEPCFRTCNQDQLSAAAKTQVLDSRWHTRKKFTINKTTISQPQQLFWEFKRRCSRDKNQRAPRVIFKSLSALLPTKQLFAVSYGCQKHVYVHILMSSSLLKCLILMVPSVVTLQCGRVLTERDFWPLLKEVGCYYLVALVRREGA